MTKPSQRMPIISFYSYKGGSGRSVCAANTVGFIAELLGATPDAPLLIMDMDVDSAGLTNVLSDTQVFEEKGISVLNLLNGNLQLTSNYEISKFKCALEDVSQRVIGNSASVKSVLLLGNVLGGRSKPLEPRIIGQIKRRLSDNIFNFSAIVLDSAAGRQPAALMAHMISDVTVYCCRLSSQHLIGTRFQLQYHRSQVKKQTGEFPKVIVVPVAVPLPSTNKALRKMEDHAKEDLQLLEKNLDATIIKMGVPEVQSLKWIESVLRTKSPRNLMEDEKTAISVYGTLAQSIVEALNTDQYVRKQNE